MTLGGTPAGRFLSRLGASYYARCGRDNPAIRTPADAERLAREDDSGAWPTIRELIEAEMLMTPEELEAARFDVACEYEPDNLPPVAQSIELESLYLCDNR